jgi:hypothetical protein
MIDMSTESRRAAAELVCYLVTRADDAVPAELRADWPALCALDAAGGVARLREQLVRDPGLATALMYELGQREREIEAFERPRGGALQDLEKALRALRRLTGELHVPGVSEALDDAWRALGAVEAETALRWRWRPEPGTGARVKSRSEDWATKMIEESIASLKPPA